jgi:hypothetical protein
MLERVTVRAPDQNEAEKVSIYSFGRRKVLRRTLHWSGLMNLG